MTDENKKDDQTAAREASLSAPAGSASQQEKGHLPDSLNPFDSDHPASAAYRMHLSPHEWTWTQEEQEAMARALIYRDSEAAVLRRRIKAAQVAFCGDKSDGETAAEMFRILSGQNDRAEARRQ